MRLVAAVMALGAATSVGFSVVAAPLDPKATEVIQRSRTTEGTYSVYWWRSMAGSRGHWAADFHSGPFERVETPVNRIVADCVKMTGAELDLSTGQIDRADWVAKVTCGIQSLKQPLSTQWLGRINTSFGSADRITITDDASTRTYDVLLNGALASSTYRPTSGDHAEVFMAAIAVLPTVPAADIFSEASLQSSFVPEQYKRNPEPISK